MPRRRRPDHDPIPERTPEQLREKYPPTRLARLWQELRHELANVGVKDASEVIGKMREGKIGRERAMKVLEKLKACREEKEGRMEILERWFEGADAWRQFVLDVARFRSREEVLIFSTSMENEYTVVQRALADEVGSEEERTKMSNRLEKMGFWLDYVEMIKQNDTDALERFFFQALDKRKGLSGGSEIVLAFCAFLQSPFFTKLEVVFAFQGALDKKRQMNLSDGYAVPIYQALMDSLDDDGNFLPTQREVLRLSRQQGGVPEKWRLQRAHLAGVWGRLDPEGFWHEAADWLLFDPEVTGLPVSQEKKEEICSSLMQPGQVEDYRVQTLVSLGEFERLLPAMKEAILAKRVRSSSLETSMRQFAFRELVNIALLERAAAQEKTT